MLEIKEEMSKVLANTKLPFQIQHTIEEIYKEYEKSYKKLIEYLKIKYPNKLQEIIKLELDTLQDYKDDMHMTQTIEFEEYEQRRVIIIETINDVLKYMKENKEITEEKFENNMANVVKKEENERFTKIVMDNTISEIVSSGKYFINRINHLGLRVDGELEEIEKNFLEEIKSIKENATQKVPEINQTISKHIANIYEQLKEIIEKYRTELSKQNINTTGKKQENDVNER